MGDSSTIFLLPREHAGSSVQRGGCGEGGRSQRQPCLDALEEVSLIYREEWQDYKKLKRKSIWNSQLSFWIASDMPVQISVTKLSPPEMPFISSLLDLSFTLLKGQLSIVKPSSHHTVPWMTGHCAVTRFPSMCIGVCEWRALLSWYGNLASLSMFVNTSILSSYFRNLLFQVKGVMRVLMFSFTSGLSRRACIISRLAMKIRKEILMPFHLKSLIYGSEKKEASTPHPFLSLWGRLLDLGLVISM